jgi:hypothetical protein
VSLADNAELMKLSGRGAVNVSALLDYTWSLWRGAKLTTLPPPARAPVEESVVASLIRAEPKLATKRPSKGAEPSKKAADRPLLTHHQRGAKLDEEALTDMAGWLAGLFPRSSISVVVHRNAKLSEELAGRTIDRYGVAESRLRDEKLKALPGVVASIAVWPVE